MYDCVAGVVVGNNLEMFGSGDYNCKKIIVVVEVGMLSCEVFV